MAKVVPFPLARRRHFVWKQARWYAEQQPNAAEKQLAQQLKVQRQTLENRGVEMEVINAEIAAVEGAIRAEVWRIIIQGGGAA